MNRIKGINIKGRETQTVPVSLISLAKIAVRVREMLMSDGLAIDEDGEYILTALSHISQGAIDDTEIIKDMTEEKELNN